MPAQLLRRARQYLTRSPVEATTAALRALTEPSRHALTATAAGTAVAALQRTRGTSRARAATTGVAVAAAALAAQQARLPTRPPEAQPTRPTGNLRTLTLNVLNGNTDAAALQALYARWDPDVVILAEDSRTAAITIVDAGTTRRWPNHTRRGAKATDTTIFTRLPVTAAGTITAGRHQFPTMTVTTRGGTSVQIIGVHLSAPTVGPGIVEEVDAIAHHVTRNDGALVVTGDMNCAPWAPPLRSLLTRAGLRDGRTGRRRPGTWAPSTRPSVPAILDLDQVLHTDHVTVDAVTVDAVSGTDHRAIICDMTVR